MTKLLLCGREKPNNGEQITAEILNQSKERLKHYLLLNQLKFTKQRWKIAELIIKTGGHVEAKDILKRVKKSAPHIGAATVYRSIKTLCEAGILDESLHGLDGHSIYELSIESHHDHIVCLNCNEIFEFQSDHIEKLQDDIAGLMRFKVKAHRHVVYAQCQDFQDKKINSKNGK